MLQFTQFYHFLIPQLV